MDFSSHGNAREIVKNYQPQPQSKTKSGKIQILKM